MPDSKVPAGVPARLALHRGLSHARECRAVWGAGQSPLRRTLGWAVQQTAGRLSEPWCKMKALLSTSLRGARAGVCCVNRGRSCSSVIFTVTMTSIW
jgi:hypothetical protein